MHISVSFNTHSDYHYTFAEVYTLFSNMHYVRLYIDATRVKQNMLTNKIARVHLSGDY